MQATIMTAEEARKIATEVRNNRGILETRRQMAERIKRAIKEGCEELAVYSYDILDEGIWQELRDLGYIVSKKDARYGECMIVKWG